MPITLSNTQIIFNNQPCEQTTGYCNPIGSSIIRYYTSSGPGTWPRPNITGQNTLKAIKVTVVGAGGPNDVVPGPGSAKGAGGGAGGGTAIKYYPGPSIPGPQPFVVGAAHPGIRCSPAPAPGSANAVSSFGSAPLTIISATGGEGACGSTGARTGGSGSGGDINFTGGSGTPGIFGPADSCCSMGGQGGRSIFSGGSSFITFVPGSSALTQNNFGGGAIGSRTQGGPAIGGPGPSTLIRGGGGIIIIEEFY